MVFRIKTIDMDRLTFMTIQCLIQVDLIMALCPFLDRIFHWSLTKQYRLIPSYEINAINIIVITMKIRCITLFEIFFQIHD